MISYPAVSVPTVSVGVLLILCAAVLSEGPPTAGELKVFSGEPRLIVVHGYSTSFHWWAFLQRKIDRYTEGPRLIEVRPALRGGTPIARWMDVRTGEPREAWTRVLQPALQAKGDRPAIVLCQQSLQWAFGERGEGIRSAEDREHINQGADVLEKYARLLLGDGADAVFLGMHIYKHPMEPEIGNERLALAELLTRNVPDVHGGPDVWEPTKEHYPKAFADDKLHPNSIGAEVMAQMWFEALLEHDGLTVPRWSRNEMARAVTEEPLRLRGQGFQKLLREWGIEPPTGRP